MDNIIQKDNSIIDLKNKIKKGFTLIELLVVISIIGILATLVVANLNEARARARDVRKKQGMRELKTALQLYYNDYKKLPAKCGTNTIAGCGASGTTCCPVAGCPEFAAGGTGCEVTYMNKFPEGLGSNTIAYYSSVSTDIYCIKTSLENASDPDIATSKAACTTACTTAGTTLTGSTEYAVCNN